MALTLAECGDVITELHEAIIGGWILKIHQPHPYTLTFDIRVPGDTWVLVVCVEPRYARVHLASEKFENPSTPPPFCQFLRAHVEGGRIEVHCSRARGSGWLRTDCHWDQSIYSCGGPDWKSVQRAFVERVEVNYAILEGF